jgi:hypothetical protein
MSISNKQKSGGTLLRSVFLTITLILAGFMLSSLLPLAYPLLNIENTNNIWPLRQPERLSS